MTLKPALKKLGWGFAGAFAVWAFTKTQTGGKVDAMLTNTFRGNK